MEQIIVTGGNGSPAEDWDGALSDLEERAQVDSLEDLHARRRQIMPEYAALRALHGPFGKWDAKRKAMLSAIKIRTRLSPPPSGKWTDDSVEAVAYADEQFIKFVDEGVDAATRYVMLEMEVNEIEERIKSREIGLYAYKAEAGLR